MNIARTASDNAVERWKAIFMASAPSSSTHGCPVQPQRDKVNDLEDNQCECDSSEESDDWSDDEDEDEE